MIRVNIERLILDGVTVPVEERAGLQASVERELGSLFAGGGLPGSLRAGGAVPEVRGEPMKTEGKLADRIARSVYGAIAK